MLAFFKKYCEKENWRGAWILLPYAWYAVLLIGPLLILLSISFSEFRVGAPPYAPLWQWINEETLQINISLSNYIIVLKDSFYLEAYANSIFIAVVSTAICLLIGYPMAYGIANSKRQLVWLMLAVLPFWISFLVRIYAWINLLSPQGLINHCLSYFDLGPLSMINNRYAVIIGIVYSYLPFMIFPIYAVLEKLEPLLLEAAYDLGCHPLSAFWRITVPLSRSGIYAGCSMVFIPVVGEYIIPEFLGGPTSLTIGRLLWSEFFTNRDWPVAAAISVVMIILLFIPIVIFEKLQNSIEEEARQ